LIRVATLLALVALPAAAEGWEDRAAELAPAWRACLADRPGAMVVQAWPMKRGLAVARLLLRGDAREDCVADPATGAVDSRRAVSPGDRHADEGLRAFMLERRCVDARRLVDAAGREMGWLAYPACG